MTTDKSAAPERIWVDDERPFGGDVHVETEWSEGAAKYNVEYTRSDLIPAMLKKAKDEAAEWKRQALYHNKKHGEMIEAYRNARNEALRELLHLVDEFTEDVGDGFTYLSASPEVFRERIEVLIDTPAPPTPCTHCFGRSANDRCLGCGAQLAIQPALPTPAEPAGDVLREALMKIARMVPNKNHNGNRNDHTACQAVEIAEAALAAAAPAPQPAENKLRDALVDGIAQTIDHPCVYAGGPSYNSLRIAEAIVREYGTNLAAAPQPAPAGDPWRAFAAQSRKLQAVLGVPGVTEILARLDWDGWEAPAPQPAPDRAEMVRRVQQGEGFATTGAEARWIADTEAGVYDPQPAPEDREALVEAIRLIRLQTKCSLDDARNTLDALIADGWRKPTDKGEVK